MSSLFEVPKRTGRDTDSKIAKRVNSKTTKKTSVTIKGGGGLVERINTIRAVVEKNLGQFKDQYSVITDEADMKEYIDVAIKNGVISIDTETMGLDPMVDSIVGLCIYTPGCKAAYVPVHHRSYITNIESDGQLSVSFLKDQLSRLVDADVKVIMFNAAFDIRVIQNWLGVKLTCHWDCYLGARLLNENEGPGNNKLKKLHNKYVLDGEGDAFSFDDLFKGITFDLIPINVGYLYAAHDAIITYELYEFQRPYLTADDEECISRGLTEVAWVFRNIEMPCVAVVADMENIGVDFDMEYANVLQDKYHSKLDEALNDVYKAIDMYSDEISAYKNSHLNHKLSDPINVNSPIQIAILLYDVLAIESVDTKSPRGTGEAILEKIDNPICSALLTYRGIEKLVSTYIDKLPECVNDNDGRIHCKFNQYGADTGRFSSQDPNLQNIPSHNKDIRKMFKATDGYVLMSSDYSQQEPKCLASLLAKQGDSQMLEELTLGRDAYSSVASAAFNMPYEDCVEFRPDGTVSAEGKERRSQAKSILLGVLYGRGVPSIAEQLGCSVTKAQSIKDNVFKGFPAIKNFEADSIEMAKTVGYVTTVCGRKRRLPSMMKPDYEVVWKDGVAPDSDPLSFDLTDLETEVPLAIQNKWINRVKRAGFINKRSVFEAANKEGIWIIDNTRDKDVTKVVNARIQGSAADLTKLAMIKLHNDVRMKELGFRMLIPVHDEIIAECPEENAKECSDRLALLMSEAAQEILQMPIKCDVEVTKQWYGETIKL